MRNGVRENLTPDLSDVTQRNGTRGKIPRRPPPPKETPTPPVAVIATVEDTPQDEPL